jgi:hypothetical protein
VEFFAVAAGERWEMGGEIPAPRTVTLRARITRATGQQVAWMRNGRAIAETQVPANAETMLETEAHAGDWFTIVVRDGGTPTLFANAIYVRRN